MCVQYVVIGPNMLYGISGSLLLLVCSMSNRPNVRLFPLDTEELYDLVDILNRIFPNKSSHDVFTSSIISLMCADSCRSVLHRQPIIHFYIPHERRRPGGFDSSVDRHWICTRMDLHRQHIYHTLQGRLLVQSAVLPSYSHA